MPAKKAKRAKKPSPTIRAKKSIRATEPVRVRATDSVPVQATSVPVHAIAVAAPARSASPTTRSTSPRTILLGLTTAVAVGLLIVALQSSERTDVEHFSAPLNAEALPAAIVPPAPIVIPDPAAAPRVDMKKFDMRTSAASATVVRSAAANTSIEKTTAMEPLKATTLEAVSNSPTIETTPTLAAESTSKVAVDTVASVTITGCLANDDDTFVLKDTSGADAPKARSWRSGFLKKRAATIELLDATKALRLPSYVGQRVEATGMLVNHEMRAHSLRRVAASCS